MAFDNSFLSPRGLLINNNSNFVCHGPNFANLKEATQATENLPYSDQTVTQQFAFSELGYIEYGYRQVRQVCKTLVQLPSTAEEDDGKEALSQPPPPPPLPPFTHGKPPPTPASTTTNQTTAPSATKSSKPIRDRLERLKALCHSAEATANILKEAIDSVTETKMLLKRFEDVSLDSEGTVERLRKCHGREAQHGDEHFQEDLDALEENLQQAVGATVEIVNDLTALSDYVAEHTEPGPGPPLLLNLEEAALLKMWKNLPRLKRS
ncbi:hypothetical protein CCMA1212_008958 [Trichoderma ghanense]|uniref:Uncharacterized protein n=1 Tax=Trichoderma ghanense TaxID=65468 RepID=A0ABY2GTM2_9HYPO